jgi:peptidoglycan hydrolase CwlO-like protein
MDLTFLERLQEIEDMFLQTQSENKSLTESKVALESKVAALQDQIEHLNRRIQELEQTAEQSVTGINRVWTRVFGSRTG